MSTAMFSSSCENSPEYGYVVRVVNVYTYARLSEKLTDMRQLVHQRPRRHRCESEQCRVGLPA
jgi:hypothetical protein